MNVRSILTEPSKPAHPAFRYQQLLIALGLLAADIWWRWNLPPSWSGPRYTGLVVILMLLFNHLAYQFKWPVPVTVAFRILCWSWLVLGSCYVLYVICRMMLTP